MEEGYAESVSIQYSDGIKKMPERCVVIRFEESEDQLETVFDMVNVAGSDLVFIVQSVLALAQRLKMFDTEEETPYAQ